MGLASALAVAAAVLGEFEAHGDIGAPRRTGSATFNAASQEYGISGAGAGAGSPRDEFHFAWKKLTGDFILQARVELVGQGVDLYRTAGWMVRASLDADSHYAAAVVHGDGLPSARYRKARGAITEEIESTARGADIIQLERKGHSLTFSAARFGDPYTVTRLPDLMLGDAVYVGLFAAPKIPKGRKGPSSATSGSSVRPGTGSSPTATTSAATWSCSTSRAATARSSSARPSRSKRPTGRPTGRP
jgi:regulation of enolase protein 1 (concanavalin A-like superfamily)